MHLNRNLFYCGIAFIAGILVVLVPLMLTAEPAASEELRITESSAAIGALSENTTDRQVYSYSFVLYNGRGQTVNVSVAEPVFSEGISDRIITEDTSITVNESLTPGSSMTVEGSFVFDARGLTKDEIVNLEPFIDYVRLISVEIIDNP
ncbi:hypothetical protein [Methanolobus chelungpuianus]|uniref:Uncharacterized protein n=1 Tax=Methanolobus chelungpuianus TaxID=502115 RepID=A0AAE3KXX6_9EURY|nr:hypothetical protein [Methanolobus chelungpuianus]MCQ6963261.1 hypothetical protein [Methanolobus chelungpuianus]